MPQNLLGIAIDYALGQWRSLEIYLTDARVEIDNKLVENAIRPTAIGKKIVYSLAELTPASAAPSFTP